MNAINRALEVPHLSSVRLASTNHDGLSRNISQTSLEGSRGSADPAKPAKHMKKIDMPITMHRWAKSSLRHDLANQRPPDRDPRLICRQRKARIRR